MDPYGETGFGRIRVSQSVVNMFENLQMRRILKHSLGLEYDYELGRDDEETWVQHHIDMGNLTSCGCGHGHQGHHGPHGSRSSSFAYRQPHRSTASNCCPSPLKVPPGDSDSERKARQIQESKKEKERAEKKKKKKMKQKERKRREKLKKENKDTGKKEEQGGDDDEDHAELEEKDGDKSEEAAKCKTSEDHESKSEEESSDEDDDSCASEEELDMTSSFVSKAAVIAKRQLDQRAKALKVDKKVSEKEFKTSVEKPDEEQQQQADDEDLVASSSPTFEDIIQISNDLAVMGNKCASAGDFVTAVRYYTDAIKYNPTEIKLFGNRSLCFEKMQEYEKALADAELLLGIRPSWVKGLFRKGKALAGLKRYDEAATALKEVLKLDACCVEAAQELMQVQIIQLMEYGFTREQSSNALIIHRTVEKSLEVLSKLNHTAGAPPISQSLPTVQVANANGVSPVLSASRKLSPGGAASSSSSSSPPPHASDAARNFVSDKPARPFHSAPRELFPVWVGSLDPSITEPLLYNLFKQVGTISSIKVLTYKRCAFVNFTKQESCEEAINLYNGHEINGIRIVVRYPDRIPAGMGISSSAHKAEHQFNSISFHKKNQFGNRRPV